MTSRIAMGITTGITMGTMGMMMMGTEMGTMGMMTIMGTDRIITARSNDKHGRKGGNN